MTLADKAESDFADLLSKAETALAAGQYETAADLFNQYGNALMGKGQFAEAIEAYNSALAAVPDFARSMSNMGVAYMQLGQPEQALPWFQKAFDSDPTKIASLQNLIRTLRAIGRPDDLLAPMIKFHEIYPTNVDVIMDIAELLSKQRQHAEAVVWYNKVLSQDADNAHIWNYLASELKDLGHYDVALEHADRAEALEHKRVGSVDPEIIANRAFIFLKAGKLELALASLEEARKQFPDNHVILVAMANTFASLMRWEEAKALFEQLRQRGGYAPQNDISYAEVLFILGKTDLAMDVYTKLVTNYPELLMARFPRAQRLLMLGRLEEGWAEYKYRYLYLRQGEKNYQFSQPLWKGESPQDLKGPLLVVTEQGFGDTLQFSRYVPMLAERGYEILFEVHPYLEKLYRDSFSHLNVRVIPTLNMLDRGYQDLFFAAYVSLMDLPRRFGTTLETIPDQLYLSVSQPQVQYWARRLARKPDVTAPQILRIGLVWAGDPRPHDAGANQIDKQRSCKLLQFAPLAKIPSILWFSLQKGPAAEQLKTSSPGMEIHDFMDEVSSFAETAAIIKNLDLVISVDTSVVHLAGGLGVPVWILSRFDGCWRWLLDRDDSPWYPSARLFRQKKPGDWETVIEEVAKALEELTKARRASA